MLIHEFRTTIFNTFKPEQVEEVVTMTSRSPNLPELLEVFERYLKASGFVFRGHLEFFDEDDEDCIGSCDDSEDCCAQEPSDED